MRVRGLVPKQKNARRRIGVGAAVLSSMLWLSSCSVPTTTPFDSARSADDALPAYELANLRVDPDSVRFQGDWRSYSVYLVRGEHGAGLPNEICILILQLPNERSAKIACGDASVFVSLSSSEVGTILYAAPNSSVSTTGFTALSDYVYVKE